MFSRLDWIGRHQDKSAQVDFIEYGLVATIRRGLFWYKHMRSSLVNNYANSTA